MLLIGGIVLVFQFAPVAFFIDCVCVAQVPDLCHAFYSLASYACEMHIQGLAYLTDSQISYFGRLLRLGIFGSAANTFPSTAFGGPLGYGSGDCTVTHHCLEILTAVVNHYLVVRTKSTPDAVQTAERLCVLIIGEDSALLQDLFTMMTTDNYSTDIESAFSSLVLDLIHLNPVGFGSG